VVYRGRQDVAVVGKHQSPVPRAKVEQLVAKFREANYYALDREYTFGVSDNPIFSTSISIDGRIHSIKDYAGLRAGMPKVVEQLENAIDEIAGTEKWIRGTHETVPALRAEGFDFKLEAAGRTLAAVAGMGDLVAVQDLIRAGVPLGVASTDTFIGAVPLRAAVWNRDPEVMRALIAAEASKDDQTVRDEALTAAKRAQWADLVEMLVKYGAREASR
jgi:hypothetical protein